MLIFKLKLEGFKLKLSTRSYNQKVSNGHVIERRTGEEQACEVM